jgi:hypothetical protein
MLEPTQVFDGEPVFLLHGVPKTMSGKCAHRHSGDIALVDRRRLDHASSCSMLA